LSKKKNTFKLSLREKQQSQRQLKVAGLINGALIDCFRKGSMLDPRLEPCPLTITKVNISPDLSVANCFFLPFNTNYTTLQLLEALEASKYAIRAFVTKEVNLKYSPEIRFHYDLGFENTTAVEELLKKSF
jgi:ribosome-binding factor A